MAQSGPFKKSGNVINLIGIMVGAILLLISKPFASILGPAIVFICGALLLWHLPWIDKYRPRQVFSVVVLAIACFLIGYKTWPEQSLATDRAISTEAKLDEIKKIVRGLGEEYTREALMGRYPLGYVIFDLDYAASVFPYTNQLPADIQLNWKTVRLTHLREDWYELRLPDISLQGHLALTNKITSRMRVGVWGASMIDDILVQAEVLALYT